MYSKKVALAESFNIIKKQFSFYDHKSLEVYEKFMNNITNGLIVFYNEESAQLIIEDALNAYHIDVAQKYQLLINEKELKPDWHALIMTRSSKGIIKIAYASSGFGVINKKGLYPEMNERFAALFKDTEIPVHIYYNYPLSNQQTPAEGLGLILYN